MTVRKSPTTTCTNCTENERTNERTNAPTMCIVMSMMYSLCLCCTHRRTLSAGGSSVCTNVKVIDRRDTLSSTKYWRWTSWRRRRSRCSLSLSFWDRLVIVLFWFHADVMLYSTGIGHQSIWLPRYARSLWLSGMAAGCAVSRKCMCKLICWRHSPQHRATHSQAFSYAIRKNALCVCVFVWLAKLLAFPVKAKLHSGNSNDHRDDEWLWCAFHLGHVIPVFVRL